MAASSSVFTVSPSRNLAAIPLHQSLSPPLLRSSSVAFRPKRRSSSLVLCSTDESKSTAEKEIPIELRYEAFPTVMDINKIQEILPHRFPFLLVDRVIEYTAGVSAVAIKNVTINDNFFPGHFPERPIMPGVLMVEAMAQVGGIVMLQPEVGGSRSNFFFAGIDKVRFRKPVIAGDTLVMRMTLVKLQKRFGIAKMEGKAYVGNSVVCEGRISSSLQEPFSGLMQGSPLADDSSLHSDVGIIHDGVSNGVVHQPRPLDNAIYSQSVLAMFTLAKDPSPRIASLGRRVLSVIGIEQIVAKPSKSNGRPGEAASASHTPLAGLVRSSSWFDMHTGHLPLTFRTPPVSPPQTSYLTGLRRVCSLELRPHLLGSPDSGLADPILGVSGSERSLLPQSTIYNWSCGHFSKPLLGGADANEEIAAQREEKKKFSLEHIAKCQHSSISGLSNIPIANWDTKFETGTKTALLHPFSPIVVAADENERIRVWNYEEATLLNGFDNNDFPDKGISNLCLVNELDDSLLLVASCDGSVRIWKDYATKGRQKLVTGFSSIQGQKPGASGLNAVVDWQQQSGYLYVSGESLSIMVWDLDKEQLVKSMPFESGCSVTALSASQVHGSQLAAGFADGSVRLYDVRTPDFLVCATRPHQRVEKVVGLSFQPGLDPAKIVSASQAGDIQFLDLRRPKETYLTIDAHRGSLTALGVHRHAPIIASGSAKQLIKVFSLKGEQLGIIKYHTSFMGQQIGPVSCLAFHPYQMLLAAGAAGSFVSLYTHHNTQLPR